MRFRRPLACPATHTDVPAFDSAVSWLPRVWVKTRISVVNLFHMSEQVYRVVDREDIIIPFLRGGHLYMIPESKSASPH